MSILDLELVDGKRLGLACETVYSVLQARDGVCTVYTLNWPDGIDVKGDADEVMGEWWAAIGMWMSEVEEDEPHTEVS